MFSLLWVGCWLFFSHSTAQGARVAGERDVTPAAQRPSPVRGPEKAPAEPAKAGEEGTPAEKVPMGDKVTKGGEKDTRYVTIDFDNVEIALFIKFISELTGKNFVIDKAVKGKVTIISPTKISVEEAYKVFESVLEVHGYTTVPAGKITKIVPAVEARSKDISTRLRLEAVTPEDKVVTQLIPLKYADPNELRKLFTPLISKSSVMVSYPPTGMLIVTDMLSNIGRLLHIIEAIDVEGIGEEIWVVPLENAVASVMAKSLSAVFQQATRKAQRGGTVEPMVRIVPDERTNALIVVASEDMALRIKNLIRLLDRETPRGEGNIHVYYLQNANAEDLSKVLTSIPKEQVKEGQKGKAPVISKEVQIVADTPTNSLVITAAKADYLVLEDVIRKLDISRHMVYLEALIMEVSLDKNFELGVQWQAMEEIGSVEGKTVAGFGASIPPSPIFTGGIPSGFSLGVLGDTITIGGIQFPSIAAVVNYLQTDSDVQILSTPQILTTDNEEAEIVVAENVPYLTRVDTTADVTGREFANYEFRDVGVTLNITPQINQERFVRLKITETLEQIISEVVVGLPTTLKRTAKTTVIVKDGNTVVIGGLISKVTDRTQYRVPCLGDIPGLGWLFKSITRSEDRNNLFIFLTPHIVENPVEAEQLYEEKKEEIDGIREGVIKMYERGQKK